MTLRDVTAARRGRPLKFQTCPNDELAITREQFKAMLNRNKAKFKHFFVANYDPSGLQDLQALSIQLWGKSFPEQYNSITAEFATRCPIKAGLMFNFEEEIKLTGSHRVDHGYSKKQLLELLAQQPSIQRNSSD